MSYTVEIQNTNSYILNHARLIQAAEQTLEMEGAARRSGLTIVLTDNSAVSALNGRYRGIEAPTDILSFPADHPSIDMESEPQYLGDLVIAYPYAREQALTEEHDVDDSFALLVIHGTLHLLGYDHDTPEARSNMWAHQEAVLDALGISRDLVPSLEGMDEDAHDQK